MFLKIFSSSKKNAPKPLTMQTYYGGSPIQKQLAILQAETQFAQTSISTTALTEHHHLIGLKKQAPILANKIDAKLFIMYSTAISDAQKEKLHLLATQNMTEIVICAPKYFIDCLKVSPENEPPYYLIKLDDIRAINPTVEEVPTLKMART